MVEKPLASLEVEGEAVLANAAQLEEAEFRVAPEGFDAADVVPAAGELVLVMMNAAMFVTLADEAVAGLPAVGVDVGAFRARAR